MNTNINVNVNNKISNRKFTIDFKDMVNKKLIWEELIILWQKTKPQIIKDLQAIIVINIH